MQIAFYAPFKPPGTATSEQDRDSARLLMEALSRAGHAVEVVSTFRSFDDEGDAERQLALREEGTSHARLLASEWTRGTRTPRPDMWLTHHVYYKAPDWLGPLAATALQVPYVIAEASHAPKQAGGRWGIGHDATADAIRQADLVLCPTRKDVVNVEPLVLDRERVVRLPPFVDTAPFRRAAGMRAEYRQAIAETYQLDANAPWIVVASKMQTADQIASYQMLATAFAKLGDLPWRLIVIGNGPARADVEAAFNGALSGRACFLGDRTLAETAAIYAAADLFVWPGINETYGTPMYEAQAAGTPVICCTPRGVPDPVEQGLSGMRILPGEAETLAEAMRALLLDTAQRRVMGQAAAHFMNKERSVDAAAARLDKALAKVARSL
jgi:glycosyltransferase involved in cell wall biosynthesis